MRQKRSCVEKKTSLRNNFGLIHVHEIQGGFYHKAVNGILTFIGRNQNIPYVKMKLNSLCISYNSNPRPPACNSVTTTLQRKFIDVEVNVNNFHRISTENYYISKPVSKLLSVSFWILLWARLIQSIPVHHFPLTTSHDVNITFRFLSRNCTARRHFAHDEEFESTYLHDRKVFKG